jgi:hypothetical protein
MVFDRFGAWLRTRCNMSHSQCYGAEAGASQIGSRVVSGVDLYSVVKELVGAASCAAAHGWAKYTEEQERDQGVARGPGGPPYYTTYYTGETACAAGTGAVFFGGGSDGFVCRSVLSYAAAGIWRPDFAFTRVFA